MDFEDGDIIININKLKAKMFDDLVDMSIKDNVTDQEIADKLAIDIDTILTINQNGCDPLQHEKEF